MPRSPRWPRLTTNQGRADERAFRHARHVHARAKLPGDPVAVFAAFASIEARRRIIYAYEMYANDARISMSVATIEFTQKGDGTALAWTEQGVYLDGFDGDQAPLLRREGIEILVDNLTGYLNSRAPL